MDLLAYSNIMEELTLIRQDLDEIKGRLDYISQRDEQEEETIEEEELPKIKTTTKDERTEIKK